MKPAISNMAWPAAEDDTAIRLARSLGYAGIELAPMRIFGPLQAIDVAVAGAYRRKLEDLGLQVPALQGLLFGVADVHLFKGDTQRSHLHQALLRIADLAVALGAKVCVFGAPGVRDPGDLPVRAARDIAVTFFRDLGAQFAARGLGLCIEANPLFYKCRFITATREAFDIVNDIASPGIRAQLDTGAMFINGEAPDVIGEVIAAVAHCHVSEPGLDPVGSGNCDHGPIAAALRATSYDGWVSVEMRETQAWQDNVGRAARLLRDAYGLSTCGEGP